MSLLQIVLQIKFIVIQYKGGKNKSFVPYPAQIWETWRGLYGDEELTDT